MYDMSQYAGTGIDISNIPEGWIFAYFSKKNGQTISQTFDGRTIKVKSFWTRENTPSLYFFVNRKGRYAFKCFSSTFGGDALEFVRRVESRGENLITGPQAKVLISEAWNEFKKGNPSYIVQHVAPQRFIEGKPRGEYVIDRGSWTRSNMRFWQEYKIPEIILFKYNVVPIQSYKIVDSTGRASKFSFPLSYGFYRKGNEECWQIYNPGQSTKYIKLDYEYYPGMDQLERKSQTLGILSGLKDIMAFESYGLDAEVIAGMSESSLIDEKTMGTLITDFPFQFSIGDYDRVGLSMMKLYESLYAIPGIFLNVDKDLAESNKNNSLNYMKELVTIKLHKKLNPDASTTVSI